MTTTVFDAPKDAAGGKFYGAPVVIDLVAALDELGQPIPLAPGFLTETSETVYDRAIVYTDKTTGKWKAELPDNAHVAPLNTYYRIWPPNVEPAIDVPSVPIRVPIDDGNDHWIYDLIVTPPGDLAQSKAVLDHDFFRDTTAPGKLIGTYDLVCDEVWHPWPGGSDFDLVVPALAGDSIRSDINVATTSEDTVLLMDVASIVADEIVAFWSTETDVANGTSYLLSVAKGIFGIGGQMNGTTVRQVTEPEIVNGLLTLRLHYRVMLEGVDTTRAILADEQVPAICHAMRLGAPHHAL